MYFMHVYLYPPYLCIGIHRGRLAGIRAGESDEVAAAGPVCLHPFPLFCTSVFLSTVFIHVYFYMI